MGRIGSGAGSAAVQSRVVAPSARLPRDSESGLHSLPETEHLYYT